VQLGFLNSSMHRPHIEPEKYTTQEKMCWPLLRRSPALPLFDKTSPACNVYPFFLCLFRFVSFVFQTPLLST